MGYETVVDYEVETKEVEREVAYSDLSGDSLDEDEIVSLQINPQADFEMGPLDARNYLLDRLGSDFGPDDAKRMVERLRSMERTNDGEIITSQGEVLELLDVDPDDLTSGDEVPQAVANYEEVEVVEKPWVSLRQGPLLRGEMLFVSGFIALTSWSGFWVAYKHLPKTAAKAESFDTFAIGVVGSLAIVATLAFVSTLFFGGDD